MARQLERDPFARATLMKEKCDARGKTCDFCGNTDRRGNVHHFHWEEDRIQPRGHDTSRAFCSRSCWECYTM